MRRLLKCCDGEATRSSVGILIEFGATEQLFTNPKEEQTSAYITGRFG